MNLDEQIQVLVAEAPQDGTTPALVKAIAPILKQVATRLRHSQYYIVQTLNQQWAFTTLENNTEPELTKTVMYAFSTLKDVSGFNAARDPQMMSLPVPVTHILFQMLAIAAIDSIIFFETPGNTTIGTEIQRQEIDTLIQTHLLRLSEPLPPDIA